MIHGTASEILSLLVMFISGPTFLNTLRVTLKHSFVAYFAGFDQKNKISFGD
jgi:hypothetical protein